MRTVTLILAMMCAAAASAQPMSLLQVDGEQDGDLPGARAAKPDTGAVEPERAALRYEWKRGSGDEVAGRYFGLDADTPAFSNPGIGGGGGACFGYNLLTARWLKSIVVPALDDGIRRALYGNEATAVPDVTIASGHKVLGPIDATNVDYYRLFKYSSDADVKDDLARAAGQLQLVDSPVNYVKEVLAGAFGRDVSNPTMKYNPKAYDWGRVGPRQAGFTGAVRRDVAARSRELALIDVQLAAGGHSLIVYKVEEGFAGPVGSADEKPAVRMLLFDPNIPDYCRKNRPYLMYFPDEERYAFDPAYQAVYAGCQNAFPTDGTFYSGYLKHRILHTDTAEAFIAGIANDRSKRVGADVPVRYIPESNIY